MRKLPSYFSIVATMMAAIVFAACETVPYTGRSQLQLISPQQESEMGVQAFQQIVGKAKLSSDVASSEMVTRVGKRIAAVTGHPEYQWEYRLIQDDKQVNAFALPGGKVAVYTGILPVTKDENGLAAVLGHEIGHVVARHGGERMSQQMGVNVAVETLAGLSSGNPVVVQSVSALLGAGASVGVLLPWGRAQESEADHLGLILMAKAGYDPHAARDLWVRMADLAAKGSGKPPEFLSTHPSEATRITQIEAWMPEAMQYYEPR
jgi:metalloendopeptidase OMA1, mitochondrial